MENEKLISNIKQRVDKFLSNNTSYSRNDIQNLIKEHQIFVNNILIRKPSFVIKTNDLIEIKQKLIKKISTQPQNIKINIIFENDDFIIVNKESGMVVHPAPGNKENTLVNALLFHFENNLSNINGNLRPGIIHRIDKDTSGLLVVAKNNEAHNYFSNLLKEHKIKRKYKAIIVGKMDYQITKIDLPIGRDKNNRQKMVVTNINSKKAYTEITVEKQGENFSLVSCKLKTGRTHQIRVHLAHIKKPIYGDNIYGKKIDEFNQRLHAYELSFTYKDGKNYVFNAPLPLKFQEDIKKFIN